MRGEWQKTTKNRGKRTKLTGGWGAPASGARGRPGEPGCGISTVSCAECRFENVCGASASAKARRCNAEPRRRTGGFEEAANGRAASVKHLGLSNYRTGGWAWSSVARTVGVYGTIERTDDPEGRLYNGYHRRGPELEGSNKDAHSDIVRTRAL